MVAKILSKSRVSSFLDSLIATARTYAPVASPGGHFKLEHVTASEDVAFDCTYNYYSAKLIAMPGVETLVRYGRDEKTGDVRYEPVTEATPTILFGLHPCDINALWMMDAPFTVEVPEVKYASRRENLTLIGIDCDEPCDENCFCKDMKTHRVRGPYYDLLLVDIGDEYVVQIGSEKGAALVKGLPQATPEDLQRAELFDRNKEGRWPTRIPYDTTELPGRLQAHYSSKLWEEEAKFCFSCGSCNLVCPTCYCFDLCDDIALDLKHGERLRRWDSCQLEAFAVVAGGENFRKTRDERLRHRCFRKGKYILEKFGRPGCVGCGRCIRHCTADISILKVFKRLAEEK